MYKWDREQILEKIRFFEQKENLSDQELESLAALRYLLGNQDENMTSTIHLNQHCMDIMKMQLLSFTRTTPFLPKFFPFKETTLSQEEQLTLVHDFYKTQPSFVYQAFRKAFDQNRHLEIGEDYTEEAYCVFVKALQEAYIHIPRCFHISSCYVLVHEYAHAMQRFLNEDYNYQNWFFSSELAPKYYERKFIDYLLLNHVEEEQTLVSSLYYNYKMWFKAKQLCDNFSIDEIDAIRTVSAYLNALSFYQRKDGDEKMAQFIKEVPRSSVEGFFLPYKYVSKPNVAMMKADQKRQKKLAKKHQFF